MSIIRKIKNIYALTRPNKLYFFLHALFNALLYACKVIEPIFAAKVVTNLTVGNYKGAYLFLTLEITQVIVRNIFAHMSQIFYRKSYDVQYMNVQNRYIDKIANASSSNFSNTPKEMLMNIVASNLYNVCNFSDIMITKLNKLVQAIVTIVIVLSTNVWIGLAIFGLSVINCFILVRLNKKLAANKKELMESKDVLNNQLSNIIDNKEVIREREDVKKLKNKYMKQCKTYCEYEGRDTMLLSYKNNMFFIFYKVAIFAITCLLIYLLSSGTMTLTLYLIVTPYLLSCTELLNEIINLTYDLEQTTVCVNRINTVLNFTEDEMIKFGKIKTNLGDKNLSIIDVKYNNNDQDNQYYGNLYNVDISFKSNSINVVRGAKNSGKRIIYYLLARKIKPTSGVIMLDNIDIYDYDQNEYRNHVFYTHTKPIFLEGSILNNLKFACKDRTKIERVCKQLGIYDYIMSLPKGFNTDINKSHIPNNYLYMINFARTVLKNSNIMLIYDVPSSLTSDQRLTIRNTLRELKEDHTIIYFTALDNMDEYADVIYTIEYGKVKNVIMK